MQKLLLKLTLTLGCLMTLSACTDIKTWQEEVKLNDGRVIVVTQKRRCDSAYTGGNMASCIERESWLTVKLPETNNQDVEWHEHLKPKILNIHKGQLYIVGTPATQVEYRFYGKPEPFYLCFRFQNGKWNRIPLSELPHEVYDTNLVLDGARANSAFLTLAEKNSPELNGSLKYPASVRKVDPTYISNFDK
jgi:hypothetical protein